MATAPATVPKGIKTHWEQILREYEAKTCTHIQITKTTDSNGLVIDEAQTESTIYGIISAINGDAVNESAGLLQYGDVTAHFMSDVGVIVGEQITETSIRLDYIEHEGVLYTVNQRTTTVYDAGVSILSKFILRKVAYE